MRREIPVEVLYDLRLVPRHLKDGELSLDELNKYLAARPDLQEQATVLEVDTLPQPTKHVAKNKS